MAFSKIIAVLQRSRDLVSTSRGCPWAQLEPEEIVRLLDDAIATVQSGTKDPSAELRLLFAPTGSLQELASSNDWHSEYLELAAQFDRVLDDSPLFP